jgi:hypothetical protein
LQAVNKKKGTGFLERLKQRKMDMRFGTWNVRRSGSLKTAARQFAELGDKMDQM